MQQLSLLFLFFVLSSTFSQQFTIGTAKSTWFEARSWCHDQQPSLELISIHSLIQFNTIKAVINQTDPEPHKNNYWIGLKHEGTLHTDANTYSWSDGSTFDCGTDFGQPPWRETEPNSLATPSCIRLGNTFDLQWDDVDCNSTLNGQKAVAICTQTTVSPSNSPTNSPTNVPTQFPTESPTNVPTPINTQVPSISPITIIPTISPTVENAGIIDLKMILTICSAATLVCCVLVGFLMYKQKKNESQNAVIRKNEHKLRNSINQDDDIVESIDRDESDNEELIAMVNQTNSGLEGRKDGKHNDIVQAINSTADSDIMLPGLATCTNRIDKVIGENSESDEIIEGINYNVKEDDHEANQVRIWLRSIEFDEYYNVFVENGFDSMKLVKEISDRHDLNYIGITVKAHQIAIMNHINKLKNFTVYH